jgi:predicted ATPase
MVSELSPLVLYLRHILNNKYGHRKSSNGYSSDKQEDNKKRYDVLFIEEPEAHLHPEVQVKLMEVFAKLSELGLKVFITSHSNYMFNKLNNLLIKKEVNKDKVQVYHLVKTPLGSTVNAGMSVSEDGIEDDNFQQTSEKLYYERLDYLENNDRAN